MKYDGTLTGKTVDLVPVEVEDAEFIMKIRHDEKKARYLHKISTSIDEQKKWIVAHQNMEGDYYFMIKDKDGHSIGTVGLSNIVDGCGETSRFISYGTALQNVEANLLITDFAFETVHLDCIRGYVSKENKGVISLQKKFGYIFEEEERLLDGMKVHDAYLDAKLYQKKRPWIQKMFEKVV